jgi:hypothetical protein
MKRRQYYKRVVKRHHGGELRGLAHSQLFNQRGLRGTIVAPASTPPSRQAIEQKCGTTGGCKQIGLIGNFWRSSLSHLVPN